MLRNTCPGRERLGAQDEVSNGRGLSWMRRYLWSPGKVFVLVALLVSYACGSDGGGCDGCDCAANSPYPAEAPAVENAVQVRLAEPGLNFIEDNLDAIVGDLLGTGLTFCVPEGQDPRLCDVRTCPSTGEVGCELSLEIDDVEIDAVEPNQLNVTVTIGGLDPMTDYLEVNLLSNCLVRLGTNNGLPATLTATLVTDPTTGDVSVEIDPESISIDFDRLEIDIDGATILDFPICEGIDLATELDFLREILFGIVDGLLGDMIGPLLNEFLCLPCEQQADCPNGSQCADLDGTMACVEVATSQCVPQPLGIETLIDLGALLSSVSPGLEAELNVVLKANGLAKSVNGGATVGFLGGTYADKAECVPVVPPPLQLTVPESTVLQGNMTPGGDPFHVGIGVSKAFFDEALWGVFNSGALCLAVGTEVSDFISTGTFGLFLPSLGDITDGNAPMLLRFEPSEPPTMNIGAGTIDPDTGALIEPLLTLVWPNLNIDFFAFIDQRMVRIFTLNTTLELPLGLAIGEEGLEILLPDDLGDLFQTVDVRNSEILTETPESLEATFPSLIDVALGLLGGDLLSPIELPDLAGFQLEVVELTGIEGNSMMGLFANLALAPDGMNAEIPRTFVDAALVDLDLPDPALTQRHGVFDEEFRVASLIDDRPVATIEARAISHGLELGPGEAEFSWRLDGGMWTVWQRDNVIVVDHSLLLLQGRHTVEIRARRPGLVRSVSPEPTAVAIDIDFEQPSLNLSQVGDRVVVKASDKVSLPSALRFSHRIDGGSWSAWGDKQDLELGHLTPGEHVVEVRVVDEAGFETVVTRTFAVHGRVTREPSGSDCECNHVGSPTPLPTWWMLLGLGLVGLLGWRLRRRQHVVMTLHHNDQRSSKSWQWLGMLLVFVVGVAGGCTCEDDSGSQTGKDCPDGCPFGEVCIDDICQVTTECESDSDCAEGICVENECFADGCRSNDDCEEGICQENPLIGNSTCVSGACEIDEDCAGFDCGSRDVFCAESTGMCTCTGFCEEGCSDTQFCCNTANACQDLPDPCDGVTCDPGQEPEVSAEPSGNSDTCEVTEGACGCVDLPPLELGTVGRYSDSALLPGGGLAISAYNSTYGDLMVGILGANDEIDWTFVDGVPSDGDIRGAIDGPRSGNVTPGDDVGTHTSIAVDNNGVLHIAYRDVTNQSLKYAQGVSAGGDYTWTVYTLDTEGNAGLYTDITLGSDDVPAIAYMSANVVVSTDQPVAESRLIWLAASSAMPDDSGWTPTILDFGNVFYACEGGCESGECRLDTNTCESPAPASACNDSCGEGEACFGTACVDIAVDGLDVLPEGVGLFASAIRTSDGSGAVAYYDRTGGDLRLVRQIGGAWQTPEILDGRAVDGTDTTDAGQFCNLFVDGDDNLHIAYVDAIADDLRYLDVANMTSTVVDAGIRIGPDRVTRVFIGDDAKIAMDDAGNLVIVYQDATQHDLLVATQNGNAWQIVTIAGDGASYDGSYGFYNTHHYTGGESLITTFKYQRQTDPEESGIVVFRN